MAKNKAKPQLPKKRVTDLTPTLIRNTGERILAESVVEQIRRKREELEELSRNRIAELLESRKTIDAELKELGYIDMPRTAKPAGDKAIKRTRDPKSLCPICNIPGHDKRQHRNHQEAFTDTELKKRGLPTRADSRAEDAENEETIQ
jgi:hypothetical protein